MNTNLQVVLTVIMLGMVGVVCSSQQLEDKHIGSFSESRKVVIQFILGSTRQGRSSDKIGQALIEGIKNRNDIVTEVVDLRTYDVPFLNDSVVPASRKKIIDPVVAAWSKKISEADAYIIIVPEYNAGYPGVLKNALDFLFKEWNSKPVAFVGYSGGPSGGASVVAQLRTVTQALKMISTFDDIKIPCAWKAFDQEGDLADKNIVLQLHVIIDQIANFVRKNK